MIRAIHQVVGKSSPGYSISDFALALQDDLRQWGFESLIYASEADTALGDRVRPLRELRKARDDTLIILHYMMATAASKWVKERQLPLIFYYHNITPTRFFTGLGGSLAEASWQGRSQLAQFRPQTRLAMAASDYSRQELLEAGYENVVVQPILIPKTLQQVDPNPDILAKGDTMTNLLFVGRLAPNKRIEDVIKVLYQYQQIEPNARLYLVGETRYTQRYVEWLRDFVQQLGLSDAVQITGQASRADLAAYYQIADVFVMMSEHEGFGIPLVESMRFDLPIIAYASSAVPETLGGAGILIQQKNYRVIAELIHLLRTDPQLHDHICQEQRRRALDFAPARVLTLFRKHLDSVID